MMHSLKKATVVIVGSVVLLGSTVMVALAATTNGASSVTLTNPIEGATFTSIETNVIQFLSWIAIPIAVIMVLVGAFQMMTSAGDPEKATQGRKTIQYAAIGFAIALIATGITSLITNILTGQ
jgi:hypothetical protein